MTSYKTTLLLFGLGCGFLGGVLGFSMCARLAVSDTTCPTPAERISAAVARANAAPGDKITELIRALEEH